MEHEIPKPINCYQLFRLFNYVVEDGCRPEYSLLSVPTLDGRVRDTAAIFMQWFCLNFDV